MKRSSSSVVNHINHIPASGFPDFTNIREVVHPCPSTAQLLAELFLLLLFLSRIFLLLLFPVLFLLAIIIIIITTTTTTRSNLPPCTHHSIRPPLRLAPIPPHPPPPNPNHNQIHNPPTTTTTKLAKSGRLDIISDRIAALWHPTQLRAALHHIPPPSTLNAVLPIYPQPRPYSRGVDTQSIPASNQQVKGGRGRLDERVVPFR
mmetsp:Transcript_23193/g.48134  ORF Transcript_23193/g.48134 Transcript_23193/m.48134 type:complete len:204 (-) Transcript_23193:207-818(-)